MIFRRARPEDAEAISRLIMSFKDQYTVEADGAGAEKFFASISAEAENEYIRSDRYRFLLAEDDGELAGFIAMRDYTHVFHLFVSPRYQRRGLARELWRRVRQDIAPAMAGREYTVNSSVFAVPVYERFGFRSVSPTVEESGIAFVPMRLTFGGDKGVD